LHDASNEQVEGRIAYATAGGVDSDEPVTIGNLAVLSVRLIAVYCLLQAIPLVYLLPGAVYLLRRFDSAEAVGYVIGALLPTTYLAVGAVFLARSSAIAMRVLGASPVRREEGGRLRPSGRAVQSLAFAVLGVGLFVFGASELIQLLAISFQNSRLMDSDVPTHLLENSVPSLLAAAVKIGSGVWLFLGSKRIANYWRRIRMSHTSPIPSLAVESENTSGDRQ
jgi:hypothetical protein